jgi:hypothetical protein
MMLEIWLPGQPILGLPERVAAKWADNTKRDTGDVQKEIDGISQANASAPFGGLTAEKFVKVLEVTWNSAIGTGFQNSFRVSDLVFFVFQTKPRGITAQQMQIVRRSRIAGV